MQPTVLEQCLRLISGAEVLTIAPTDGKQTIAKAEDLFHGYLDPDYQSLNVEAVPTIATNVEVHEMVKDGDFRQIFGGLSDDLDSLCLTQAQIIEFLKHHRKWLRTNMYTTIFLFKVDKEFFVAGVFLYSGGRSGVRMDRFDDDHVWLAEGRRHVVVPQLAPLA